MPAESLYNEKELFLQIAEGSETAFTELYRRYVPQLAPFISAITHHSDMLMDEIIQETFLRLWMNREKLIEVREPGSWIFRIAANVSYTYLQRSIVQKKVMGRIAAETATQEDVVEGMVHVNELLVLIREAVSRLSPQRKKIYSMSRDQGLPIGEIASALRLSPNTVKNTLVSSLQFIREYLKDHGHIISLLCCILTHF